MSKEKNPETKAAILERVEAAREELDKIHFSKKPLGGFIQFIREQGVMGLAIGLVLGTAAKSVVDSIVNNLFNPVIGLATGGVNLNDKAICLGKIEGVCSNKLAYGRFFSDIISFVIVALVIYMVVKGLKLDRLDKKSDKPK